MSDSSSDDGRRSLSELRKSAPTGDHRAVEELLAWARRRADEILASLSPDSELLELLRAGREGPQSPTAPSVPRAGGTRRGIPIPDRVATPATSDAGVPAVAPAAPDPSVIIEALPRASASDDRVPARVSALHSSPVARVLPRTTAGSPAGAREVEPPARRHPRYAIEAPVTIRYDEWSDLVELCTRDISKGGMFVTTDSPPPMRSKVTVRLQLPHDAGVLEATGEVVHVMGGGNVGPVLGFGLQFDELSDRRRAMLDRLVDHARDMSERPRTEGVTLTELGLGTPSEGGPTLRLTLAPEEITQLVDLRAELASMEAKDDLALLGLTGAPSQAAIDAAFEALETKWHPDQWEARAVPEVEELAMDVFRRIEAAYMRASADARRREARPTIAAPAPVQPEPSAAAPEGASARSLVHRLLERGERLAERLGAATVTARISTLEFNKLIGRGFEQLSGKDYRAAIVTLQSAVDQRPESTKAQILLLFAEARLLVAKRELVQARAKYEEVLKIDPGNATAQRDLVMLACLG